MTINTFLTMGGYASYVWPAYSITVIVFVLNFTYIIIEKKKIKKIIQQLNLNLHNEYE